MTTITNTTANLARPTIGARLAAFGNVLMSQLMKLAEYGPMMAEVRRLNDTSDAELSARGLTREGEVRRIFGPRMGL